MKNDVMSLPNCGDISTWVGLITLSPPLAAANFLTSHNSPSHCWNLKEQQWRSCRTENVVNEIETPVVQIVFRSHFKNFSNREILNRKELDD